MKDFRGRVAVVTGAASGMGLAFAHRFADEGMTIVAADIEAEPLAMAEAALKEKGATVMAQRLNVAHEEEINALADRVFSTFGNVHILCNNAGVAGPFGAAWELSIDDWRWVMDVNLWSVIYGTRAFLPRMLENGDEGHIVSTASLAGMMTGGVGAPYNVTKFGVVAFSEHLYKSLKQRNAKVSASVLCPGLINTNIIDSDRVRPADYGRPEENPQTPSAMAAKAQLQMGVQMGFPPEYAANQVFEAIRDDQFYIIPAQEMFTEILKARHDDIVNKRNPAVAPVPAPQ